MGKVEQAENISESSLLQCRKQDKHQKNRLGIFKWATKSAITRGLETNLAYISRWGNDNHGGRPTGLGQGHEALGLFNGGYNRLRMLRRQLPPA